MLDLLGQNIFPRHQFFSFLGGCFANIFTSYHCYSTASLKICCKESVLILNVFICRQAFMDCLGSALSSCSNGTWLSEYSFVVLEHGIMDKKCGVCPEHSYDSLIGALQGKRITTPFSSTINGTTVICVFFVYPLESSNNVDLLFCSFQCFSNDSSLQCLKKRIAFFISRSRAFFVTTCDSNYSFTLLLAEDYCTPP